MKRRPFEFLLRHRILLLSVGIWTIAGLGCNGAPSPRQPASDDASEMKDDSSEMKEVTEKKDETPDSDPRDMIPIGSSDPTATKEDANHSTRSVFYATNRNAKGTVAPHISFGTKRGSLTFGKASVSIPRDHRMGHLEEPSIWKFEMYENPDRHVMVLNVSTESKEEFAADLKAAVQKSPEKSAFVFVHGFSVNFKDALRRTGQLAYDLGFDGAAVCFTWPSQESVSKSGYLADIQTADWAAADLAALLDLVRSETGATKVHLIAHSMGNKVLCRALERLKNDPKDPLPSFNQVVLTAPDIDADVFQREIASKILPFAARFTLYASNKDWAMTISEEYAAGYRRLGDSSPTPIVLTGIESVDVSAVDTSFVGHTYYGDNRSVLSDLFLVIRHGFAPANRNLREMKIDSGKYWVFAP